MIDGAPAGGLVENPRPIFKINQEGDSFRVTSPHIDLKSEGDPLLFSVTLEKAATPALPGKTIDNITIDSESPKLQEMREEARVLREIPERERPRRLLELLRSNVGFAYEDVMAEIAVDRPETASWVAENTGPKVYKNVTLSQVVDYGYGVCRHLSVAMLDLAREAGMEGAYASYSPPMAPTPEQDPRYLIKNVIRPDNGKPIFRTGAPGDYAWSAHAWVELKTSDGEWIPVDPTTQLVGDTLEGLETFREANYIAFPTASFRIDGLPPDTKDYDFGSLWFLAGEGKKTGTIKINSRLRPKISIIGAPEKTTFEPTLYSGPLEFIAYSKIPQNSLNVKVADIKPA